MTVRSLRQSPLPVKGVDGGNDASVSVKMGCLGEIGNLVPTLGG